MINRIVEKPEPARRQMIGRVAGFALVLLAFAAMTGCQTEDAVFTTSGNPVAAETNEVVTLSEGDVLKISFPGSPSLDTLVTIRKDGIISLPLVGEVQAAGQTPAGLDQKLTDLYASQLTSKEVIVEVQSSAFPIYVTGTVLRPGKIISDQPMTALEAVMEAGGFDYTKADMKEVVVIRKEGGGTRKYTLDLKAAMEGNTGKPFYLKPDDIVFVPEKFNWF